MSATAGNVRRSIAPAFPGDEAPRRVGRFELVTRLGAGGMANVFLARSQGAAGFERLAAIKLLHRHLSSDEQFVQMFFDEARVAARIHHPNVVPILDLGTENDQLYMVMDYVEGDTLAAVQRAGINLQRALPAGVVLRVMLDALAGLEAAHELRGPDGEPLNVVHRDVSPQNIIVGVDGVSRLVDFGIARAERRLALTSVGTLKGKAPFMAPEQLEGRPVDRRADVFSMGVTLWESLALRRLYPARNDVETVTRAKREAYRPLSALMPHLPPELDPICEKALSFDPDDRYATAGEFADAIEAELRAHVATHRQVAAFMAAVAADKVGRERNALRAAMSAPRSEVAAPRSEVTTATRGRRYNSGVQPLQRRHDTPAPVVAPPPSAMPDLSGLPDLPAAAGINELPDLPDLDVATSVSHATPSVAPVRARHAAQSNTRVGVPAPARPRAAPSIAQAALVEPEPLSQRPPSGGVQVVRSRVQTHVGPAPQRPQRATPPMGVTPPSPPEVARRPARSTATLTGVGEQGEKPITAQDIEDAIRELDSRGGTAPRPLTEAVSSVRKAAPDAGLRAPTPPVGTAVARDEASEFDLGPRRSTLRAPGPNGSITGHGGGATASATKSFVQPPRAPSADVSGRHAPPPSNVAQPDEAAATTRMDALSVADAEARLARSPDASQKIELRYATQFTPPPETSVAQHLGRAAAVVSVISAAGILWLIFR